MTMHSKMIRILPVAAVLVLLAQAHCLLIPEDVDVTDRVANKRPSVRITAGATRPDTAGVDYKVQFHWHGYDSDGVVTHFQWAVNDTVSEEAWNDTTAFTARFSFSATTPRADTPGEATDWHTFYIRAVDNDFAMSMPDKRHFNARTIAPTSRITFPILASQLTQLQRTLVVQWDGEDLDSSQPDRKPVAYEFKLVKIPDNPGITIGTVRDSLYRANNMLLDTLRVGSKVAWIRVPESERRFILHELPPIGPYSFAVRAIDEAGATEPTLDWGRNVISFYVTPSPGSPIVTVSENSVGSHRFPTEGEVWNIDVPANRPLYFRWTGDASHYGSLPGNSNFALNIPDPEDESRRDPDGIGGWVGWGDWSGNRVPFIFGNEDGGTTQTLYVKMRDVSDEEGSTTNCTIVMRVVSFTFERFALAVDDARFQGGGGTGDPRNDAEHDAFLEETTYRRLRDFGDVDEYAIFVGHGEMGSARGVPLHVVAQYRHIVWNHNFKPGSVHQSSGLIKSEEDRVLTSYVGGGGRLFIFGGQQAAGFAGNFGYPILQPAFDDVAGWDQFFRKFLYFRNIIVSQNMSDNRCVNEAGPLYVARSSHPSYPDLYLDTTKRDPWEVTSDDMYRGGIRVWEGNKAEALQHRTEPLQLEGLDTLYVAQTWDRAWNPGCGNVQSPSRGAVCGQRYESTTADSLAGTQHGRLVTFNFQTWFLQSDRLLDANTSAINWLVTGRDH